MATEPYSSPHQPLFDVGSVAAMTLQDAQRALDTERERIQRTLHFNHAYQHKFGLLGLDIAELVEQWHQDQPVDEQEPEPIQFADFLGTLATGMAMHLPSRLANRSDHLFIADTLGQHHLASEVQLKQIAKRRERYMSALEKLISKAL